MFQRQLMCTLCYIISKNTQKLFAQVAEAEEYTDCFSAEG